MCVVILALGVDCVEGERDEPLYVVSGDGRAPEFWMQVLIYLKQRGVRDNPQLPRGSAQEGLPGGDRGRSSPRPRCRPASGASPAPSTEQRAPQGALAGRP